MGRRPAGQRTKVQKRAQAVGRAASLPPPVESDRVDGGYIGGARVHDRGKVGPGGDVAGAVQGGGIATSSEDGGDKSGGMQVQDDETHDEAQRHRRWRIDDQHEYGFHMNDLCDM